MTLSLAWVRRLKSGVGELLFACDCRLSGGNRFDHVAKLFPLPRRDCGMAFAGHTYWAYPMMTALVRATEIHEPARTNAMPLRKYLTHLVRILNQMQIAVHSYVAGENIPDFTLSFGGWDWRAQSFRLWQLRFDQSTMSFSAHKCSRLVGPSSLGIGALGGDDDAVKMARNELKGKTAEKIRNGHEAPSGPSRLRTIRGAT
jgi:hypothetical protein